METAMKLGSNKTGIDMSPIQSKEMLAGVESFHMEETEGIPVPTLRQMYLAEADALGSVPMPGTVKGVAKAILKTATGHHPEVFINKLGERLAYERSGVRTYDALILKCNNIISNDADELAIDIERLKQFREQEAEHFALLAATLEELGADPTAQTPDADAAGVGSSGLMKVVCDPRTSISQTLEAMLAIELADNSAWELLIKLADNMGLTDVADKFHKALQQENLHLITVRHWYEDMVLSQATMA